MGMVSVLFGFLGPTFGIHGYTDVWGMRKVSQNGVTQSLGSAFLLLFKFFMLGGCIQGD